MKVFKMPGYLYAGNEMSSLSRLTQDATAEESGSYLDYVLVLSQAGL